MDSGQLKVLILGAGINGCALARELALNGIGVWLVDVADVAAGATAGSSRLIHGGLRYLEYGEFDLVKESLGRADAAVATGAAVRASAEAVDPVVDAIWRARRRPSAVFLAGHGGPRRQPRTVAACR